VCLRFSIFSFRSCWGYSLLCWLASMSTLILFHRQRQAMYRRNNSTRLPTIHAVHCTWFFVPQFSFLGVCALYSASTSKREILATVGAAPTTICIRFPNNVLNERVANCETYASTPLHLAALKISPDGMFRFFSLFVICR
jgi:hypothetical protein